MKKLLLSAIISLTSLQIQTMQQISSQAAARSLASTVTPTLKTAKRTFYNQTKDKPLIDKIPGSKVDYQLMQQLQSKYPHIHIPKIYDIQQAKNPSLSQIPAGAMPRLNPFKSGYIIYNPKWFKTDQEIEFVMLHELGHIRHQRLLWFMRMSKYGMRSSIILATFFKLLSIKYGLLGSWLAPALFWKCYMRLYEEPSADNFAIKHAQNKDILKSGRDFFARHNKQPLKKILLNHEHPTIQSRINKIQRALDDTHDTYQLAKLILLMSLIEYSTYLMYKHSKNEESIQEGLIKVKEIEDNFEQYCDKWEIPAKGRPTWKYCLETVKIYLEDRLEQLKVIKEKQAIKQLEKTILEKATI